MDLFEEDFKNIELKVVHIRKIKAYIEEAKINLEKNISLKFYQYIQIQMKL
jgi:hypothetical protein